MSPIPQEHLRNIEHRLSKLYPGHHTQRLMERFKMMIGRYGVGLANNAQSKPNWSEIDALLIAYPDNLQGSTYSPLKTLHRFCRNALKDTFTSLHILPCFPYSSDDGFSVIDYRRIEPRFGSWEDIQGLSKDFTLMLDLVLNHCSIKSNWFQHFINSIEPHKHYFISEDPAADLSTVTRPRTTPLLHVVDTRDGQMHVWCTFGPDQADLNWKHPDVFFEFLDILLFYISQGASKIRLDAVGFLWKQLGTSCIHLPETHQIVKLLRDCIEIAAPGVQLIAEVNVPHRENLSYLDRSDEAHIVYNFSLPPLLLHTFISANSERLQTWAKTLPAPPKGTTTLNFAASHDGIGLRPAEGVLSETNINTLIQAVEARGGKTSYRANGHIEPTPYELNTTLYSALTPKQEAAELSLRRYLCLHALLLSFQGIPAIYFNSLMATPNIPFPEEHPRTINRKKWQEEELRALLEKSTSPQSQVFAELKCLLEIRKTEAAFHPDAPQVLHPTSGTHCILERHTPDKKRRLLVLCNVTAEPQSPELPETFHNSRVRDLLSREPGDVFTLNELKLAPYQTVWAVSS